MYVFGSLAGLITVYLSRSTIPSFFSRRRILESLKDESQELSKALSNISKFEYSKLDFFIVFPLAIAIFIAEISGVLKLGTIYTTFFLIFVIFNVLDSTLFTKIRQLLTKKTDEITKALRRINDTMDITEITIFWAIFLFSIFEILDLSHPETYSAFIQQLTIIIAGMSLASYIWFIIAVDKRYLERGYLAMLYFEGKLMPISVKIRLKSDSSTLFGKLLILDFSSLKILEEDGYTLSLDYNKIETISTMN